ncbi:hypothetical protein AMTRI_Chr01g110660 [Amborella trichopoda]
MGTIEGNLHYPMEKPKLPTIYLPLLFLLLLLLVSFDGTRNAVEGSNLCEKLSHTFHGCPDDEEQCEKVCISQKANTGKCHYSGCYCYFDHC